MPPEGIVLPTSRTWAHDSIGVGAPATEWYLTEGSTAGGDEMWVLLQNPTGTAASVTLTYVTATATRNISDSIPANSRKSFRASDAFPETRGVSVKVKSNQPVVAEKAVYGNHRTWGHDSVGISTPATEWYLAEGCTAPGFETWVLVQNPNDKTAKVSLTYMTSKGTVTGPSVTIPPRSRKTFEVAKTVSNEYNVSTKVTSDQPVVAERAMYGNNRTWAHDSVGVSEPGNTWYLAEGCTLREIETWVLVQNPNATRAAIAITYMTPNGPREGPSVYVPANSRMTFNVADAVNLCSDVSTKVTSDSNVVVERAMYGDPK